MPRPINKIPRAFSCPLCFSKSRLRHVMLRLNVYTRHYNIDSGGHLFATCTFCRARLREIHFPEWVEDARSKLNEIPCPPVGTAKFLRSAYGLYNLISKKELLKFIPEKDIITLIIAGRLYPIGDNLKLLGGCVRERIKSR